MNMYIQARKKSEPRNLFKLNKTKQKTVASPTGLASFSDAH